MRDEGKMLTRVTLVRRLSRDRERYITLASMLSFGTCDVPEQCRIIFWGGGIFIRDEIETHIFERAEYLLFDRIDPDTICVVKYLDHERSEAA
jgi:hypothetical protein